MRDKIRIYTLPLFEVRQLKKENAFGVPFCFWGCSCLSNFVKSLGEVLDDVLGVFRSDGKPDGVRPNALA